MQKYYQDIIEGYRKLTGTKPEYCIPLPPSASNRQYYRLSNGKTTVIAAYNPDRAENEAFLYISRKLSDAGVRVPEIYHADPDNHFYILQDLGDCKLFDLVEEYRNKNNSEYLLWYQKVIDQMPAIQHKTAAGFDFSICFPRAEFDEQSILWDLNYFKYYFLKLSYVPFHEQKLEDDFHTLTDYLLKADNDFFMFRDFQSRNIMVHHEEVYFIDYQGGRKGALQYDLASLLFEAKAGLSSEERRSLLEYYLEVFAPHSFFDGKRFLHYFPAFCLIRILQAFGAYGYRGYFEGKSLFLQSIPPALVNLRWVLDELELGVAVPHLSQVLYAMADQAKFPESLYSTDDLLVDINSFSYKKGIPKDYSGHGGGFVFDCRALPNPGRYEAYKDKTGKDKEVVEFLEEKQEIHDFLKQVSAMVSNSVENYLDRGHEHLLISFGCTGGQHRSVFCAEKIHRLLREKYDIKIRIHHRELEG